MNQKSKNKIKFYQNKNFYLVLMVLATLLMSVGYATVNSVSLDLVGEARIKSAPGIYVYNAQIGQGTNGTNPSNSRITMLYNDVMKSMIVLGSNTNSTLSLTVTIYNTLSYDTIFTGITYSENFYDNNKITYDLSGISVGTVLPANSNTSFTMTFRYTGNDISDNILNSYLKFNFKKFYTITYQNIDTTNKDYPTYILDEESSKTVTFTGDIPYDVNITPSVSYTYNSPTLTLNNIKNNITINRYYSITYHLNGGTNAQNQPSQYLHGQTVSFGTPTNGTLTFDGWYQNASFTGTAVSNTSGLSGNLNLYAKWTSVVSYTIAYELNGGTNPSNQVTTFYMGTPQNILDATNSHDGTFDGWYTDSGFTSSVITSTSQLSGNSQLYAKWSSSISNTTFDTTNNRFVASNVSSVGLRDLTRNANYQYLQSTANTTINSIKLYITYSSSNKSGTLVCQVASNTPNFTNVQGNATLNTSQTNAVAEVTLTMSTPIPSGNSYTISFPSYSGDNNGKIKVNGVAFEINP